MCSQLGLLWHAAALLNNKIATDAARQGEPEVILKKGFWNAGRTAKVTGTAKPLVDVGFTG